jgi:hypothetical protein
MSVKAISIIFIFILFSSGIHSKDKESFDVEENEAIEQEPISKTYFDCYKSKQLHLKKTSDSYMIQIPYDGKHSIAISDSYGKVLSSFITTDKEEWYNIDKSLPSGTYVVKLKTPEMKLFKFVVVI